MENSINLMPEMSEKFDVVITKLMLAKKEMGSTVKKDAKNPFHKSTYASLGAHLELCEVTLDKHGLIMLQTVNGLHDKATLIATICHPESGQWIKSYLPLPNPKGDSQGLGASITYMRRYSINSMLGLNAEDDDAESACIRPKAEPKNVQKSEPLPQKLASPQVDILKGLEKKLDAACKTKMNAWLTSTYQTEVMADLPKDCFNRVLGVYENAVKFIQSEKLEIVHA